MRQDAPIFQTCASPLGGVTLPEPSSTTACQYASDGVISHAVFQHHMAHGLQLLRIRSTTSSAPVQSAQMRMHHS